MKTSSTGLKLNCIGVLRCDEIRSSIEKSEQTRAAKAQAMIRVNSAIMIRHTNRLDYRIQTAVMTVTSRGRELMTPAPSPRRHVAPRLPVHQQPTKVEPPKRLTLAAHSELSQQAAGCHTAHVVLRSVSWETALKPPNARKLQRRRRHWPAADHGTTLITSAGAE